jgi:hypothetical protein
VLLFIRFLVVLFSEGREISPRRRSIFQWHFTGIIIQIRLSPPESKYSPANVIEAVFPMTFVSPMTLDASRAGDVTGCAGARPGSVQEKSIRQRTETAAFFGGGQDALQRLVRKNR